MARTFSGAAEASQQLNAFPVELAKLPTYDTKAPLTWAEPLLLDGFIQ